MSDEPGLPYLLAALCPKLAGNGGPPLGTFFLYKLPEPLILLQ
jgi:hypothetical protein